MHSRLRRARRPRVLCTTGEPLDAGGRLDQFGRLADGALLHLVLLPTPHQPSLYAHLGDGSENDRARAYGFPGSLYERCGGVFGAAAAFLYIKSAEAPRPQGV